MSASALYAAGYTDLVSVIPPGAELSPNSSIAPNLLGKVPGKQGREGWYGYAWQSAPEPTAREVAAWEKAGANIGIRGTRFPGLDIDANDGNFAKAVLAHAVQSFGKTAVRRSRGSRLLLPYRAPEPFARSALIARMGDVSHLVEFLGDGRQYLLAGRHPSGAVYRWHGRPLWEWEPGELPEVSRESVQTFFDALEFMLRRMGFTVERTGDGRSAADKAALQDDLRAPSLEDLRAMVERTPNTYEAREDYIRYMHAVKAAGGVEALDIFAEWAARWEDGHNDPEAVERDYLALAGPFRAGWSWLIEQAEELGDYQSAPDEFAAYVDPNAVAPEKPPELPRRVKFTDESVATEILPSVLGVLRYVPATKTWRVWRDGCWRSDERLEHDMLVRRTLRAHALLWMDRADAAPTADEAKPWKALARRYQSANGIEAIVKLLRGHVAVGPEDFDRDPWVLNTPGGKVDLRTGVITASEPGDMLARMTLVGPKAGPHPLWSAFLMDATGGDRALIGYLQRFLGYCLTGDMGEKVLAHVYGGTDTGKSTLVRIISAIFGTYADTIDADALLASKNDRIPAELARMPGVRMMTATEPSAGKAWDEKRIKAITGGDRIEVRFLHGNPFTFSPQMKVFVVGNSAPEIKHVDEAMLRRINIVPLDHHVPRERQIDGLDRKIIEQEGAAVLAWMVEGCRLWAKEGLKVPEAVRESTDRYAEEEDTLALWISEECELEASATATRSELYAAWSAWCRSRGEQPGGAKAFGRTMAPAAKRYGLIDARIGTRRGYQGIALRPAVEEGTEFDA